MTMPYLPPELISDILLRLPVKDLVRYSSVSKRWHGVIRSKDFIKEHHQRAINSNKDGILLRRVDDRFDTLAFSAGTILNAEEQPMKHPIYSVEERKRLALGSSMVACCNGLILVKVVTERDCLSRGKRYLFVWNPMIAKHRKIPYVSSNLTPGLRQCYGLGYHYDEDDMKVLTLTSLITNYGPNLTTELKIYSLASDTWKRVEKLPPSNLTMPFYQNNMVSLNNSCVAWEMIDKNAATGVVVTFDLLKEEYDSFPIPNSAGQLIELGGFLFYYHCAFDFTNVWIMNKDSNSWTLKLSFQVNCEPLFFDGERFLLRKYVNQSLLLYSTKTQECATTQHRYIRNFSTHTIFCVGNLRLLLDGDPDGMDTFGDH